jgi:hypothetical protein
LCDTIEHTDSSGRLDGPIVEICVGKEPHQKIFSVHQGLIAPRSEFFERAFNGNWKETESRLVNLPEDNARIFSLYVQLLYTGKIPTRDDDREFVTLCELYVLCEKLQDIDAKNETLQAMLAEIRGTHNWDESDLAVFTIYDGTPENSPARSLLLDLFVERGNHKIVRRLIFEDYCHEEFLRHLAVQLFKRRSFEGSETLANCNVGKYQEKKKEKEGDKESEIPKKCLPNLFSLSGTIK